MGCSEEACERTPSTPRQTHRSCLHASPCQHAACCGASSLLGRGGGFSLLPFSQAAPLRPPVPQQSQRLACGSRRSSGGSLMPCGPRGQPYGWGAHLHRGCLGVPAPTQGTAIWLGSTPASGLSRSARTDSSSSVCPGPQMPTDQPLGTGRARGTVSWLLPPDTCISGLLPTHVGLQGSAKRGGHCWELCAQCLVQRGALPASSSQLPCHVACSRPSEPQRVSLSPRWTPALAGTPQHSSCH